MHADDYSGLMHATYDCRVHKDSRSGDSVAPSHSEEPPKAMTENRRAVPKTRNEHVHPYSSAERKVRGTQAQ